MLRRLSVENYALIDKLEMELDPRLNIITGETGAGKSILLGALGLLLGAKNDGSAMKDAARNCTVEGIFDLTGRDLEAFFDENDLDYAPETTLTRIITPTGKSRAFINDVPVQLAQLRELGSRLIDIHSQHQNLILVGGVPHLGARHRGREPGAAGPIHRAVHPDIELRRRLAAPARSRREGPPGRVAQVPDRGADGRQPRAGEQAELEEELTVLGKRRPHRRGADHAAQRFRHRRNRSAGAA